MYAIQINSIKKKKEWSSGERAHELLCNQFSIQKTS